ncbi:hypothetical protein J6590_053996 [Homalodisca vitripennis]|nr:hypothetical protein J6590_053996 [Homalodisca vitripennis]
MDGPVIRFCELVVLLIAPVIHHKLVNRVAIVSKKLQVDIAARTKPRPAWTVSTDHKEYNSVCSGLSGRKAINRDPSIGLGDSIILSLELTLSPALSRVRQGHRPKSPVGGLLELEEVPGVMSCSLQADTLDGVEVIPTTHDGAREDVR